MLSIKQEARLIGKNRLLTWGAEFCLFYYEALNAVGILFLVRINGLAYQWSVTVMTRQTVILEKFGKKKIQKAIHWLTLICWKNLDVVRRLREMVFRTRVKLLRFYYGAHYVPCVQGKFKSALKLGKYPVSPREIRFLPRMSKKWVFKKYFCFFLIKRFGSFLY